MSGLIDLGVVGEATYLVLDASGVPYGVQNAQGETAFGAAPPVGALPGVTDGSSAAAGKVGEVLTATTVGTPVAFAATATHNICSLSLTAGDWDVWALGRLASTGGSAIPTDAQCGLNTVTGTLGADGTYNSDIYGIALNVPVSLDVPPKPISVSTTTNIYLVMHVDVTSGTDLNGYGIITARRRR